jgi:hypothetical protein
LVSPSLFASPNGSTSPRAVTIRYPPPLAVDAIEITAAFGGRAPADPKNGTPNGTLRRPASSQ